MRALLATAASLLLIGAAAAEERPLAFTVAGPLVQPGAHQLLLSVTPRLGRPEAFTRIESLVGFAYGFSDTVEAQLLLAIAIESFGLDSRSIDGSAATRWRWQPLNGRSNLIGVGVIGTVALSVGTVFVETRLALEKWFGDFLFAINLSADYVVRKSGAAAPDTHLEQTAGVAYRLSNGFTTGFEVRNRIGFARGNDFGSAAYAGPVFGYRAAQWWLTLAALPQVAALKAKSVRENGEALELRDNERFVFRVQLGVDVP